MMYGLNESFNYFECSKCGCLQIEEIPNDMKSYYPSEDYYSLKKSSHNEYLKKFLDFFGKKKDGYALNKKGVMGKFLYKIFPYPFLDLIGSLNLDKKSKILDVGCGNGILLNSLYRQGFTNLTGLDPYIDEDVLDEDFKIFKKEIFEIPDEDKYDLIILSHSLEHMPQQLKVLLKIDNILSKNGICIVAMPVKTEYIWGMYGTNWVQIDAPRHFIIHTLKSFNLLIGKTNLSIEKIVFNSSDFQFWGSEQYKKGIKLKDEHSYSENPRKSLFNKKKIKEFKKKAEELNKINQGDQAIFILKKIGS